MSDFRRVKYKYEDIKCDGYIFGHLGHHLTMAGLTPLFPDIYLNLGYVEASLKATGPVDILSDYRKYRQYIMGEVGNIFMETKIRIFVSRILSTRRRCRTLRTSAAVWGLGCR